jgi:CubicO group peptidase (beta-lactamase class C family)
MPYDKYVEENIFRPLGMNSTSVFPSKEDKKHLVTPYSHRLPDGSRRVMPFTDAKGLAPAANITSNIDDLSRFVALQFQTGKREGAQILDGYTLAEMHRLHFPNKKWTGGYGLGFRVWKEGDMTVNGHGGWVAGNRSQISFIPAEKVGVIILTNADDVSPSFFANRILERLVPVIHKIVTPPEKMAEADPRWKKYTGIYSDPSWYDTEVMIYKNRLVLNNYNYPPEEQPDGGIVFLTPVRDNVFKMDGPNGNGETVVFIMDRNDRVVKIKVGENYIFPKNAD